MRAPLRWQPTTGLDPQNQRHVWDVINELKRGRVVVLTTHLMDEADTLGDRIGIMSNGKLVALGDALHLKAKFGGKYKVAVTPADAARASVVAEALTKALQVPAAPRQASGADAGVQPVRLVIEPKDFAKAPALFEAIDALVAKGVAKDWNLSRTSLEDVFVGLELNPELALRGQLNKEATFYNDNDSDSAGASAAAWARARWQARTRAAPDNAVLGPPQEEFSVAVPFSPSTGKQVRALVRKSLTLQLRQPKTLVCQLLAPLLLVALLFVFRLLSPKSGMRHEMRENATQAPASAALPDEYRIGTYMAELDWTYRMSEWYSDSEKKCSSTLNPMHVVVAVAEPRLKDKVGASCGPDVYGTFDSAASPLYRCDPCTETAKPADAWLSWKSGRYSRPLATAGLDGENVAHNASACDPRENPACARCQPPGRAQCLFDASDPLFNASELVLGVSDPASVSGLLRFYPSRLVRSRYADAGSENDEYTRDTRLCPVELAPLFQSRADGDMTQAVNDLLFKAQVARTMGQAPFDKPVSADFAGWQRARELLNNYFPDGAIVFHELDSSSRVSFTYHSYFAPPEEVSATWCGAILEGYSAATVPRGPSSLMVGGAGRWLGSVVTSPSGAAIKFVSSANYVLNGVTSAVLSQGGPRRAQVSVGLRAMPGTDADAVIRQTDAVDVWAALLFIPLATTFMLPMLVFQVVYEKEGKLRASLFMSGLKVHVYWVAQYLINLALALFVLLFVYTALMLMRAKVYSKHSFGIVLLLLVLWANAMVALSFLLSVAFSRTRTANISLYLLVFLAIFSSFAMQTNVFASRPHLPAPAYWISFPPFAYYRGTYLLATRTYSWHEVPGDELLTIYGVLVLQTVLCFLATYYLDQVLPKQYGVRRDSLFCVKRAKAKGSSSTAVFRERESLEEKDLEGTAAAAEDDDVAQEHELVLSGGAAQAPIRVVEIKKSFGNLKAVDGVTFHCDKGCSAVLGPNGAGKSTVFSMLTGLYSPSAGDAFVAGRSITTDMHHVYDNIGVCPQHDVTYADLTVAEHLLLFARIKGVNAKDERWTVANALGAVSLTEEASTIAGQLSGGQRRRLSIAIAFVGSPAVVFLDEVRDRPGDLARSLACLLY